MAESQAFDEVEILDHVLSVTVEEGRYRFRLFWQEDLLLDQEFNDVDDGITELQNAFFGLEFDFYGHKDREHARDEFFRCIRTRWRWLHK
jgi:hypothetical protein